jgi:hypothetical protein
MIAAYERVPMKQGAVWMPTPTVTASALRLPAQALVDDEMELVAVCGGAVGQ